MNKVETAVHLSFEIDKSSLSDEVKQRLKKLKDRRISKKGVITIKSEKWKSQLKNRQEVLQKLNNLISKVENPLKKRKSTKPSKASKLKRLNTKKKRSEVKSKRKKVGLD